MRQFAPPVPVNAKFRFGTTGVLSMKSFSERQGIKPVADVVQVGAMNDVLRNSLWNALDSVFWSADGFMFGRNGGEGEIDIFSRILWADYFKLPVDSRPTGSFHLRTGKRRGSESLESPF